MSRRAQGEGSVYYDDQRDRWVGQFSAGVNPVTGNRRRLKVSAATKSQAARLLRERIESDHGHEITTVGGLVEDWLAKSAPKKKSPSWLATSKRLIEIHVMPRFGNVRLDALSVEMFETWMGELAEGLSKSTVIKIRSQLALAFDYGIRRRVVDWNPARIAELPAATGTPREGRALTATEARSLLNVAADHRLGAWVVTTITLGLRPGETSGLSWDDVDLDRGVAIVHRSLAWDENTPYLKTTKTKKWRRRRSTR